MAALISWPEALTPERLTDLLNERFGGCARVASLEHAPVGYGLLSDSLRFTITYTGKPPAGYPASVIGKFSTADMAIRASAAQLGVYASEVGFYREIANTVAVRRPDVLYAEVGADAAEFGIVMEDLGPARAADQLAGCSIEDARLVIEQAAALHGPRWNDQQAIRPWMLHQQSVVRSVLGNFQPIVDAFVTRLGPMLNATEIATIERFGRDPLTFYDHRRANRTIVHTDLRLDNILFECLSGRVPVAILDWQSIVPGTGALDIGFFLCTSLGLEQRRANERDLLAQYLDVLRVHGVRGYSIDALWEDYRATTYQALFTAVSAAYSARQTERADLLFAMVARGGVALMNDLDSFAAVGAA